MKNKNLLFGIIPKYSAFPLIATLLANMLAYYGSTLLVDLFNIKRHTLLLGIDKYFSFRPEWIIVYFGCYITWVLYYILICRENEKICYDFVIAEIIAKMICMVVFTFYPTVMADRATELGNSFFEQGIALLYKIDKPYNLFPSIHCLASYISFRGMLWCKKIAPWVKISSGVVAVLVFLSVLFTKQHYFIDILAGIAVVEIGIFISRKLKFGDYIRRKVTEK